MVKRPDGYVILDTSTGEFWKTPHRKYFWSTKNAASNAYNCHTVIPSEGKYGKYGKNQKNF